MKFYESKSNINQKKGFRYFCYAICSLIGFSCLVLLLPSPEQTNASTSDDFSAVYNRISSSGVETGSAHIFPSSPVEGAEEPDGDTGEGQPAGESVPRPAKVVQVRAHAKPRASLQGGGVVKAAVSKSGFDIDKLAYAVAMAETKNGTLGYGKSHNNAFGIKKGNTVPCETVGFRKMCKFDSIEDSYAAFKKIWGKWYGGFPNRAKAATWTGNDNPDTWLRTVSFYYHK